MMGDDGSRLLAGVSRWTLVPWVAMLCCVARLARADIDPSGGWTVALDVPDPTFGPVAVTVNFQRSGTSLSAYVRNLSVSPLGSFPYHLTGSIDSASGAFSVSGDSPCSLLGLGGADSLAGTFNPSGDTFTGTMSISFLIGSPIKCLGVSGASTGSRGSPTCGNGVLDSGEACDFSPDAAGCCSLDCA